jgi:choline-sulfatase/uncharacterized sulfatase
MEGRPSPLSFDECQEGWIANEAVKLMKSAVAADKPFLIHTSLPRPHQCTSPCQEFWDLYDEDYLTLPPNADYVMENKAPHFKQSADRWRKGDWTLFEPHTFEAGRLRKLHGYLGAVSQVDAAVGVMLDYIRNAGISDDTIVVYTADHGDYAAEHGIMEKAPGICADAITRVPQIWWAPGRVAEGHVINDIVESVDISTTLCALSGLEILETGDGMDISPLLEGQDGKVHEIGVTEFAWSKSVRKGKYRYVHYPSEMFVEEYPDGFCELYDLEVDPWEMRNLYFDPMYKDVVEELRSDLVNWLITTTRPVSVHGVSSHTQFRSTQSTIRHKCQINADGKIPPSRILEGNTKNYI